jgi:hypothetical protein
VGVLASSEAFAEIGDEVIADHGLEFARRSGEGDDEGVRGMEDEADGGAIGVFEVIAG